jgi:prepilin-type N-terminal cleavage/methylation domain-containing protein
MRHRELRRAGGFTLAEVLVGMAVLTVAMLGVAAAGALQGGIVSGVDVGQSAVSRGRAVSTATFLAEDRLEQIKRLQYRVGPPAVDQIGDGAPSAALPDEDYGTIPGHAEFRREVSIQTGVPGPNLKLITITVQFRRQSEAGLRTESLMARTIIAARP